MWKQRMRQRMYARRVAGTALQTCWQTPMPATSSDWRAVSFLVVDAEMSSLDVREGELLSVGWVRVERGAIALSSARYYLLQAVNSVGQSAAIHNLRDCELAGAQTGQEVLRHLLQAAAGSVLVFHNAALDLAFFDRLSRAVFGAPILMPWVDTLRQEQALLNRQNRPVKTGDLRLQACRDRYNLPAYPAHNALIDALATAELLVAHASHRCAGKEFSLARLL